LNGEEGGFVRYKAFEAGLVKQRKSDAAADKRRKSEAATELAAKGKGPYVIGDRLPKHYDYGLGCEIDSKSQERRVYKAKGLRPKSVAEHRQQHGGMEKRGPIVSYAGQKNHKGRLEGVRTAKGQLVI